jgi:uncharacterized HhH-GPD family protein
VSASAATGGGAPDRLHFTGDDEADALIAAEPLALLIGFVLDQQVTVQTAFAGPLKLKHRLGSLDAAKIAGMDPEELREAFRQKPAVHRFPDSMARRVQDLCAAVVEDYGGRAEAVWSDATSANDLRLRLFALPGFGEMKVKALASVLARRLGVSAAEPLVPDHPMLGDVDSPEALERYQAAKRARKAELRAARGT